MPQMSPMPWIIIFLLTLFSYYHLMSNIYFYLNIKISPLKFKILNKEIKIKW